MKKKTFSACIMAALLTAGITSTQATAGILAEGDISVYKGGKLSSTMTGQNPVDEEALLVCNNKCMIKSSGISIVGITGTELAVKSDQKQFNLLLKQGKLDFILSGAVGKMGFYTADGQYTNADIIFNASTSTPVRGYVQVTEEGRTAIGVYEGRMIFSTVDGAKIVDSNNYILLAQAEIGASTGAGAATGGIAGAIGTMTASVGIPTLVGGGIVLAGVGLGLYDYVSDDGPGDDESPSNNGNGTVVTIPPSQTPAGTSPNNRASTNATPPANPSTNN